MSKRKRKIAITLCCMILFLNVFGSTVSWAADELTAKEKFDQLVEAGIFTGFEDGSSRLESNTTRAQAAAIITRLMNLEEDLLNGAAAYKDLVGAEWAAGYIGAVTPLYMEGYGNEIFAPNETFTIEQLAAVMVRVLSLEVDNNAEVDGNISDWATGYVAAAVAAGIISPQSDYTVPAVRSLLVESAYTANEVVSACTNEPILSLEKAVLDLDNGDRKLVLSYTTPVDAQSVQLNDISINGAALDPDEDTFVLSDDNTELTISLNKEFSIDTAIDASIQMAGIASICGKKLDDSTEQFASFPLEIVNAPAPVTIPYYPPAPPASNKPMITVDMNKIVTVTEATYVTVTSSHTTELYYALLPVSGTAPTAAELINIENVPLSEAMDSGRIATSGSQKIVLTRYVANMDYKLYIVGTNGSLTSNLLVVDINTDETNIFELISILDESNADHLLFFLDHTPTTASGTVYYVVSINPLPQVQTPDDLVQLVQNTSDDDIIVYYGQKSWSGTSDQINVGVNVGNTYYHVYVVLEYKSIRLMLDALLNY